MITGGTRSAVQQDAATSCAWNQVVVSADSVHVEQHTAWGETRRLDGWTPNLLTVKEGDAIAAGALVLTRRISRWIKVGYVSRGPLVRQGESAGNAAGEIVADLKRFARSHGLTILIVDPPYRSCVPPDQLVRAGFTPHLRRLPPTGLMRGALLIDLQPSESELLARMRRSTRQVLRKAEQSSLRMRSGGVEDIPVLWNLMSELCRRRGCSPNVSSPELIRELWTRLAPNGQARIDILERDGVPIVALLTLCLGSWVIPWRIGWSGAEPQLSPQKVLSWSVIRSVRNAGFRTWDFNWVDPDEAKAIHAGAPVADSVGSGITGFKMSFGGSIIPIDPPMDFFPNAIARAFVRSGGGSLLNSSRLAPLLARVNRRGDPNFISSQVSRG